ncbi:NADAR family protein (plasmid) [Deinococcus taeanensis]|uniref:NADAR family protein n=1 Tax=Deinococcus taeanensis TaxID=2737050 RepID=UPI001CDC4034|nr:NADAR family protein [Deinococcus taeanensis]UBV44755.1 NADAR family protein [Deinococcus taeanensis]
MTPADPVYFYRTAHPFSNFHPSVFTVDSQTFQTAEQYIMYRKALTFGDPVSAERILAARGPGECKKLGRRVRPYDEAIWAAVREQVAYDACVHKFAQNSRLRDVLLSTGDALLVEAAPSDAIWGIGFSEQDAPAHHHQWGQNLLGLALMRVRDTLRTGDVKITSSPPTAS